MCRGRFWLFLAAFACLAGALCAGAGTVPDSAAPQRLFPPPIETYGDAGVAGLWEVLARRVSREPLNLWVTLLFLGALCHTFFASTFLRWSHHFEAEAKTRLREPGGDGARRGGVPMLARVLHFLGEVEAVFGIWCVPLCVLLGATAGWKSTLHYLDEQVSYREAIFVVVIMAIASTRPILHLAETCLQRVAALGGGRPGAWWLSVLTIGPLLGSLITEPAAMTISALLLAKQYYDRRPPARFAYATLGLLFVNVSVGGVLTHFAAPPVLMAAGAWGWNTPFMLRHFGLAALAGILGANAIYYLAFRKEFSRLDAAGPPAPPPDRPGQRPPPAWVTCAHIGFMAWSVLNAHHTPLLIGGFLFFLAFYEVTEDCQWDLRLRSPILVGFFLAGLVVHGGLQQWWIGPVLGRLREFPLMLGAIGLTAFNDNAAITYLASLVPGLTDSLKHAVMAGAVTGGGLTVIANAPNPAGQSILGRYFPDGVSPLALFLGALPATVILALCFLFL